MAYCHSWSSKRVCDCQNTASVISKIYTLTPIMSKWSQCGDKMWTRFDILLPSIQDGFHHMWFIVWNIWSKCHLWILGYVGRVICCILKGQMWYFVRPLSRVVTISRETVLPWCFSKCPKMYICLTSSETLSSCQSSYDGSKEVKRVNNALCHSRGYEQMV